jgi:quercetin dioxygenase-like cupin family protein
MSTFTALADLPPQEIWTGVVARTVEGRHMSFAIVELSPGSVVEEHDHPNEQVGIVLRGSLTFTVGDQTRTLGAGDTYSIPPGVRHKVVTGPEGAVVVDVFSPVRADWSRFEKRAPYPPAWP